MSVKKTRSMGLIGNRWLISLARLQPWYLLVRYQHRLSKSIFAFASGASAIGILCAAAVLTAQPLIFPSLGPSAFIFFQRPSSKDASPRNAVLAHGCGVLVGYACFFSSCLVFGEGSPVGQIVAAAVSIGLIAAIMVLADISHAPAASTTLIVSLGLMTHWTELIAILIGVILLTAQAYLFHRMSGICYPLWRYQPELSAGDFTVAALRTEKVEMEPDRFAQIADQLVGRSDVMQLVGKD